MTNVVEARDTDGLKYKERREVIDATIEHWLDNMCYLENGHICKIRLGSGYCPLCIAFMTRSATKKESCLDCPIFQYDPDSCCFYRFSPYRTASDMLRSYKYRLTHNLTTSFYWANKKEVVKAFLNFIDLLESL